jgi:hypothetical protein
MLRAGLIKLGRKLLTLRLAVACGCSPNSVPPSEVVGSLFTRIFASCSKHQLTFINYLFARSALNTISDCAARLPEQADNGVRAGPRATWWPTAMVVDLLANLEGMCRFCHPTV